MCYLCSLSVGAPLLAVPLVVDIKWTIWPEREVARLVGQLPGTSKDAVWLRRLQELPELQQRTGAQLYPRRATAVASLLSHSKFLGAADVTKGIRRADQTTCDQLGGA